jgi:hypothetical protein
MLTELKIQTTVSNQLQNIRDQQKYDAFRGAALCTEIGMLMETHMSHLILDTLVSHTAFLTTGAQLA